ncbi:unnamed protein product [Cuscuta epithymum]|uniref:Uncharacterized protein n=1 Tax=Cuscuta epithymum TaxID=186058 RepID=A0AAV0G199_9ASTE|nr:unnamed protein product [Cuscuta epithymum]
MAEAPSGRVSFRPLMPSGGVRLRRWPPETAGMLQRAPPVAADFAGVHRGGDGYGGSGDLKTGLEKTRFGLLKSVASSLLPSPESFLFLFWNQSTSYEFFVDKTQER